MIVENACIFPGYEISHADLLRCHLLFVKLHSAGVDRIHQVAMEPFNQSIVIGFKRLLLFFIEIKNGRIKRDANKLTEVFNDLCFIRYKVLIPYDPEPVGILSFTFEEKFGHIPPTENLQC